MPNNAFWNWAGIALVILAIGSCSAIMNTGERCPDADTTDRQPVIRDEPLTPTT